MSKLAKRLEEMCYDVFPNTKNKMRMMTLAEVIEKYILECKPKDRAKIIVDKFADLMLPTKERLDELEFMINQALAEWERNLEGGK